MWLLAEGRLFTIKYLLMWHSATLFLSMRVTSNTIRKRTETSSQVFTGVKLSTCLKLIVHSLNIPQTVAHSLNRSQTVAHLLNISSYCCTLTQQISSCCTLTRQSSTECSVPYLVTHGFGVLAQTYTVGFQSGSSKNRTLLFLLLYLIDLTFSSPAKSEHWQHTLQTGLLTKAKIQIIHANCCMCRVLCATNMRSIAIQKLLLFGLTTTI